MRPPVSDDPIPGSWDEAPCGLLTVDADGLVHAANRRLLDRLGYPSAAVVGQLYWSDLLSVGSRVFWQTQLAPVLELDGALEEVMLDLLAADGRRVPALLNATRISDPSGAAAGARIAIMNVPDRRAYEDELRRARANAEQLQVADRDTRRRLELLARASAALASSVEVDVALRRLARVLVADLADWCVIYAVDPDRPDDPPRWAVAHRDPEQQPTVEQLAALLPQSALPVSQFRRVLDGGQPVLLPRVSPEQRRNSTSSDDVLDLYDRLAVSSAIIVPSTARGTRVAATILVRGPDRPEFAAEDLTDLTDLAARAGIVIDNLRQRAREHSNSMALQRALLTDPPVIAGLEIVTRYLPATAGNQVGGDWYDAFLQSDGSPIFVIGDVVGHDIQAAAAMGQLRGVLRTIGYPDGTGPADILTRSDATARGLGVGVLASAFLGRVDRRPGGAVVHWSNAGHPPPLLLTAAGEVRRVEASPDPILGVSPRRPRREQSTDLGAGDILLLYTDGLVERVYDDIDSGIDAMALRLAAGCGSSLDQLCDLILVEHQTGRRDDIALLLLRVLG